MGSIEEPAVGTHHFHYSPQFNTQAAAALIRKAAESVKNQQLQPTSILLLRVYEILLFPNVLKILQNS